jgi:hypothetical protein
MRMSAGLREWKGTLLRTIRRRSSQRPRHRRERTPVRAAATAHSSPARTRRSRSSGRVLMCSATTPRASRRGNAGEDGGPYLSRRIGFGRGKTPFPSQAPNNADE